jgi:hypothetical protein
VVFAACGASEEYLGSLRRIAGHFADFLSSIHSSFGLVLFDSSIFNNVKLSGKLCGVDAGRGKPLPLQRKGGGARCGKERRERCGNSKWHSGWQRQPSYASLPKGVDSPGVPVTRGFILQFRNISQ